MKSNKTLLIITLFAAFFTWTTGWKMTGACRGVVPALFASPSGEIENAFVRVVVRFAKVRRLPDAGAPIVKEIGFGTMLKVLGASGDYLQVAALNAAATTEAWYVLRIEVETAPREAAQAVVETRTVTFTPAAPVAGQPLVFRAGGFRTPNLLKWDMGDGTVLISGGKTSRGEDATFSYAYAAAGQYQVKVFDDGGKADLRPVTVQVTVSTYARAQEKPQEISEKPSPADRAQDPPPEISEKPRQVERTAIPIPAAPAPAPAPRIYSMVKIGPYAGYFQPQDTMFKAIYGEGDVIYGARLGIHIWNGFYFGLSASQFKIIAKTTFSEDKTTLTLVPVSAFLRYSIRLGFFNPYAGIGYTYMNFKEESEIGNITGNGGNIAYEVGFELKMNRHFIMDFGVRYDQIKVKPTGFEIDLGGLQAGISLLVSF